MNIKFFGGAGEVGRSCIYLEENKKGIMMDCGIKLGEKVEYPAVDRGSMEKTKEVLITHAHLDHSGYLPHIYHKGFSPRVISTKPTRDLMGILLSDYRRIQKERNFTEKDIINLQKRTNIVEFGEENRGILGNYVLHNSGHIIGSAMIEIKKKGGIIYTGDISTRKTRILDPCTTGLTAETLIVENTYGKRTDLLPSLKVSAQKLVGSIKETVREGGFVLIPSFAVGRAQEIILILDDFIQSGALEKVPIYVDGMINKVMRVYRHNAIYANDDIKRKILMSDYDPFKSENFLKPKTKDRSDVLKEPCVIISTSGMLSGGPSVNYFEKLAGDPKNKIIFVGYQAEGTPGERILKGEKEIQMKEKRVKVNMKVDRVKISGHADFNELINFIYSVKKLKRIFLVHGESGDLKEILEKKYEVAVPKIGDEFRL
ncbi:MBL fold metallo-hydrolase [Candidatus Micrarchaeota archaeon]|nr:MBL fold metallo-hydrolase [Candidatus Micrarchaeota archaeon]